jgi:hypothetical protein
MVRRSLLSSCFAVIVSLAGCATVRTIPIAYAPEVSRQSAGQHDYDTAVKAIAAVMVEDLRLPRLDSVLYLYRSLGDYEAGLKKELDDRPNASERSAAFAIASCGRRKVLADGNRLAELSWANRVRTLAHEMVHLAQFALADWRCATPHYWLMEGFAEWGAYKVLDRLGLEAFARGGAISSEAVRAQAGTALPSLDGLASEAEWEAAERSMGRRAVYGESFLAVDFLIERKGLGAVADYFARFKDSPGRSDNFAAAFGEDIFVFQSEFEAYLEKL